LADLLIASEPALLIDEEKAKQLKATMKRHRRELIAEESKRIYEHVPGDLQRALLFAKEKMASSVFTTRPLKKYGFCFPNKRDFRDLVAMRYHREPDGLPRVCACGKLYSLDHSQICKLGGFIHMRHDGPKELFGELSAEVCYDVKVEPDLLPLTGEQFDHKTAKVAPDVRSDVRVRGFFTKEQNAFFEFRIVYPFASSYLKMNPADLYEHVAHLRKMEYEQRINQVDNGSFTPMILLSTGGMGAEMTIAMKHLARKLADKRKEAYPAVATMLRCSMAFNVARSALVCLRGSRARHEKQALEKLDNPSDLMVQELHLR
jgi:hypothetical protein